MRRELDFRGVRFTDLKRLNRDERYKKTLIRELDNKGNKIRFELAPNDLRYQPLVDQLVIDFLGIEQNPR